MATATEPEWNQLEMELLISVPPRITPLGDGSYRVAPQKPVVMEKFVSVREAARLLQLSTRRVQEIAARDLGARQRAPRCKLRLPLERLRAALAREAAVPASAL